ncbi:putative Amino acid transporter transmembrane domain-containing protein [Seiridium unicorne]|uniref:Amino acid transporter transmembrane domain-containing protein n=1 Tax=Seiridium unicorne TaxID=138068 RepID=A0ABR2V4Z2_9PEZI
MFHKTKEHETDSGSPGIGPVPSRGYVGETHEIRSTTHDAVFGEITEGGPNYRNVGWIGTTVLMMKNQIGLGVLSIPSTFDVLGLVPGVILLCVIAAITTWSDYIVGVFKLNHPGVYGIDDVGGLLFGRVGREVLGAAFCLYWMFVAGSAMLSISIALNAVSVHATCTAVFVAVAAIVIFTLSSIRTLAKISWLAWVGIICILVSVFTVTIAVGLQERPAAAPQEGVWVPDYQIIKHPTFTNAISAISSLVFAYAGTPAFFNIASEMRDPRHYSRSLLVCQTVVTITYCVVGIVIYYYCGSYVASPAPGSAGPLVKKVAYGIALPGLLVSGIITAHLPSKHIFVRALRGSKHLAANTVVHWSSWLGCTFGVSLVAYLIASAIPVFGGLVSLIGALLGTLMSFQPMGCMWLYDNWTKGKQNPTLKWRLMVAWSVFVVASGTFLMIAGTYGTISDIIESYKQDGGSSAWSCAHNSAST